MKGPAPALADPEHRNLLPHLSVDLLSRSALSQVRSDNPLGVACGAEASSYLTTIDARLNKLLAIYKAPTAVLFAEMLGVWPGTVSDRLVNLDVADTLYPCVQECRDGRAEYIPELHPLDFEWYFSRRAASWFAREVLSCQETTVCLGTPTVVAATLPVCRVRLIDSNNLILNRFAGIIDRGKVVIGDVGEARAVYRNVDCVVFDPPVVR